MRHLITLKKNNKQDDATDNRNIETSESRSDSTTRLLLGNWSQHNERIIELAEEDMNDPDLMMSFSGNGYMLQAG